jgi:hypothetical protein
MGENARSAGPSGLKAETVSEKLGFQNERVTKKPLDQILVKGLFLYFISGNCSTIGVLLEQEYEGVNYSFLTAQRV